MLKLITLIRAEFKKSYSAPYSQSFLEWAERLRTSTFHNSIKAVVSEDEDKAAAILKEEFREMVKNTGRSDCYRDEDFTAVFSVEDIKNGRVWASHYCVIHSCMTDKGI